MGFFSKNKNTNTNSENREQDDKSQKVALRTMQQDMKAAKESGEVMNAVIIESIGRHSETAKENIDIIGRQRKAPPTPVELPRLAETEHIKEAGGNNNKAISEKLGSDLSSINFSREIKNPAASDAIAQPAIPQAPQSPKTFSPSYNYNSANAGAPEELLDKKTFYPDEPIKEFLKQEEAIPKEINSETKEINIKSDIKIPVIAAKEESFFKKLFGAKEKNLPKEPIPETPKPELAGREENKETEKEIVKNTPSYFKKNNIRIYAGIAAIFAIVAAGGIYLAIFKSPADSVNPPENNPSIDAPVKNPKILENQFNLLEFENNYNIDFDFDSFSEHKGKIAEILAEKISSSDLKIPPSDFINIEISIDGEFPISSEIVSGILENFPETVLDKLSEKYNLMAYLQGNSPRIGLILEISDKNGLAILLKENEGYLSEIFSGLYFDKTEIGKAASENFNETVYNNAVIRYKNFPVHTSAIDYAILDNFLLISTSKDSMLNLIDFVSKQSQIQNRQENNNHKPE